MATRRVRITMDRSSYDNLLEVMRQVGEHGEVQDQDLCSWADRFSHSIRKVGASDGKAATS